MRPAPNTPEAIADELTWGLMDPLNDAIKVAKQDLRTASDPAEEALADFLVDALCIVKANADDLIGKLAEREAIRRATVAAEDAAEDARDAA